MKLNNTTQYAIRVLNYINNNSSDKLVTARELSDELSINYKFLTAIMTKLVKVNILKSIRGKDGGFKLNIPSDKIYLIDIVKLFDDSFDSNFCIIGLNKTCNKNKKCFMHDKWTESKQTLYNFFEKTKLSDLQNRSECF